MSHLIHICGLKIYMHGNRDSPSKDIAHIKFSVLENLRFLCDGGHHDDLPNTRYM